MKYINSIFLKFQRAGTIALLIVITMMEQLHSNFNMPITGIDNNAIANSLIAQSYITPEMQWSVLSLLNKPAILNKTTGVIENFEPIESMLNIVDQKFQFTHAEKESMKNALHAMLEAIDIATFFAALQATYDPLNPAFMPQNFMVLTAALNNKKQMVQGSLNQLNAKKPVDGPAQSNSYFSWILGSSNTAAPIYINQSTPLTETAMTIAIPTDLMSVVAKINDFKKMSDATQAANLLFKQCFIAQKHAELQLNATVVKGQNYIYPQVPDIYNKYSKTYPICVKAQALSTQALPQLLKIRQAIQTAIFIANKKSSVN
ncbi:MAG: hypothetical protein JO129_04605, partial [Candidatus Dependentiae bacterium]|nr:hypothetical protein [Candidatus Dependentiae bacterium]